MSSRPTIHNASVKSIGRNVFLNIRCLSKTTDTPTLDVYIRGYEQGTGFNFSRQHFKDMNLAAFIFQKAIVKHVGKQHDFYEITVTHKAAEPNAKQCELNDVFELVRLE